MEIQSLLTVSAAKTAAPIAVGPTGVIEGGEGEFGALLQEAQTALENPEATLPIGEDPLAAIGETLPIEAAPLPVVAPDAARNLAPALMAQIQNFNPAPVPALSATPSPAAIPPVSVSAPTLPVKSSPSSVIPVAPKGVEGLKAQVLPEAQVPMEISVEIVAVEPFRPPAVEAPAIAEPNLLDALPTVTAETGDPTDEEAPEAEADLPKGETPEIEGKGEAKTETIFRTDAPVKTESVRAESRLDTHNVIRELANRIELMAAAKAPEGVLIHLNPADLGSITLLVKPESGGAVSADIGASNDQVRQALQGSQQTLQRQLELRGVAVANVSVTAETADRNPQQHGQQSAYQPRQFNHQSPTYQAPSYGSPAPVARPSRLKASGVDLWI